MCSGIPCKNLAINENFVDNANIWISAISYKFICNKLQCMCKIQVDPKLPQDT